MKNRKKIFISLGMVSNIICIIISLVITTIIGYFIFMAYVFGGYPYEKIKTSISNDSKNEIIILENQGRGFFGPANVVIKANNTNFFNRYLNTHKYETEIYDDGGRGTVTIKWQDDNTAYVTLNGCEMDKETIKIQFSNNQIEFSKDERDCSFESNNGMLQEKNDEI